MCHFRVAVRHGQLTAFKHDPSYCGFHPSRPCRKYKEQFFLLLQWLKQLCWIKYWYRAWSQTWFALCSFLIISLLNCCLPIPSPPMIPPPPPPPSLSLEATRCSSLWAITFFYIKSLFLALLHVSQSLLLKYLNLVPKVSLPSKSQSSNSQSKFLHLPSSAASTNF